MVYVSLFFLCYYFCYVYLVLWFLYFCFFFFLMIRRPPRSTRTDTLFPYTTLFRSHHGIDRDRLAVFVAQGDLRLRVRAQSRQRRVLLLAHLGLLLDQAVREMDRGGHVAARLVGGVAEHQALVAGALLFGLLAVDALVDVGGLLADQVEHAAGGAVDADVGRVVADVQDHLAGQRLDRTSTRLNSSH